MAKLARKHSGILGGVAAGIGAYLEIDPTLIRLFFALFTLFSGIGLLAYLMLWIFLPYEGEPADMQDTIQSGAKEIAARARELSGSAQNSRDSAARTNLILGGTLILLGAIFLLRNLDFPWLRWINARTLWPLLLIAFGAYLLLGRAKAE